MFCFCQAIFCEENKKRLSEIQLFLLLYAHTTSDLPFGASW